MDVDGFYEVTGIISLAKELYDIDRYDIVEGQFFDTVHYDVWLEDMHAAVSSIFSGFYNAYDEEYCSETYVFTDDCFDDYYRLAWEYGKSHNVSHEDNPFVKEAREEVSRWIGGCYSMAYKLLGYTKTRKASKKSRLVVYVGMCECNCHTRFAYNLVQIYKWFSDKVAEFSHSEDELYKREEVLAA